MDCFSQSFINALIAKDYKAIKVIPKSDVHVHIKYGGTRNYFQRIGIPIPAPSIPFNNLKEFQRWQQNAVVPYFNTIQGLLNRIKATFIQAKDDNIFTFSVAISVATLGYVKETINIFSYIKMLQEEFIPFSNVKLELMLDKGADYSPTFIDLIFEYIESNMFYAIDCAGFPEFQSLRSLIPIYRHAQKKGLVLKAHLGEFSSCDELMSGIEMLELNEVTHGIVAANSKFTMNYLNQNKIKLNLCPASNIAMGLFKSYFDYPIDVLLHNNIDLSINTDDLLAFDQDISKQFLLLYTSGKLTAQELDFIRINGLKRLGGYYK